MSSVLITGAAGGIGSQTVALFVAQGWTVFATDRTAPQLPGSIGLVLDVTNDESVHAARAEVHRHLEGRPLDALINNAGIGLMGPITEMTDDDTRRMFEVNALGVLRVTRAFAPQMIAAGRGRIVTVGSLAGICTIPFLGAYSASKHAVEAICDAMRVELRPHGIRVSLVQPAIVHTPFVETALSSLHGYAAQSPAWRASLEATGSLRAPLERTELSPLRVACTVVRAATARWPRARYPVGRIARFLIAVMKALPTAWTDGLLRTAVGLGRPQKELQSRAAQSVLTKC